MTAKAGTANEQAGQFKRFSDNLSTEILALEEVIISSQPASTDITETEITALVEAAEKYKNKGNYGEAALIWEKILEIREKNYGHENQDTATSLDNLAGLYKRQGQYKKAETLYIRALAIREKLLGPNHPDTGETLNNFAGNYVNQGIYAKAVPLLTRGVAIIEASLGPTHPDYVTILSNLAIIYVKQGEYKKAEPLLMRALAIRENAVNPDYKETARSIHSLASLYYYQGNYNKAESLFIRALAIGEQAFGTDHPDTAVIVNNLGFLYVDQGFYGKAEPLLIRATSSYEKSIGLNHPSTAISLNNLAMLYYNQGLFDKAGPFMVRALAINEKALGPNHPDTATSLNNLANLYTGKGLYNKAEPLYIRALSISEKAAGPNNPDAATYLNNLAMLYEYQHLFKKAEGLFNRAYYIRKNALGPYHPYTALSLNNLACLYIDQGLYSKAEPLYIKALAITEKVFGSDSLDAARIQNNIAFLYVLKGQIKKSIQQLAKGISAQNQWLMREAPLQSKKTRSVLLEKVGHEWMTTFDLSISSFTAAELAIGTRLNRTGILQDIEQNQSLLLRLPGSQQELVSQLSNLNTKLANVNTDPKERQVILMDRNQIEAQLYRMMPDLKLQEVSPAQVASVLPADSVLVEFQKYQHYNFKVKKANEQRWEEARYLALILKPNGSIRAVPLGPAKPIEAAIAKALASTQEALADSHSNWDPVRHLILDPLQSQLKGSNHWFLSPDAELTRIPFLALPAANSGQRLLSDDVTLSVLTTGRDLLRLQKLPGSAEKAAVIVNPSYALGGANSSIGKSDLSDQTGQRRSAELGSKTWKPLPQTQQEGEEIAKLLVVPLISKDQATANHLQSIHGPKVLHIATHGFFQPNQETTPPDLLRTISSDHQLLSGLKTEDPMLRSGLVLAGADNPTANPADDGYLTAAEATGLQLDGTEIVVLSACSTGQGESKTGEGVYGMQRALTVAGARSTLLSLWKVDDEATRTFMVRYYSLLKEGKGRGEALVQVQREFRTDPAYKAKGWDRPYYWAAWQLTGDWKPIQGL